MVRLRTSLLALGLVMIIELNPRWFNVALGFIRITYHEE